MDRKWPKQKKIYTNETGHQIEWQKEWNRKEVGQEKHQE